MASTPPPPIPYGGGNGLVPPNPPVTSPGGLVPASTGGKTTPKLVAPASKFTKEEKKALTTPKSQYDELPSSGDSTIRNLAKTMPREAMFELRMIKNAPSGIAHFFGGLGADLFHSIKQGNGITSLGTPYFDKNDSYAYASTRELADSLRRSAGLVYEPGRGWFVREGDYYRAWKAGQPVGGMIMEDVGNAALIFGGVSGALGAAGKVAGATGEMLSAAAAETAARAAAETAGETSARAAGETAARSTLSKIGEGLTKTGEVLEKGQVSTGTIAHRAGSILDTMTIKPYRVVFRGGRIPFTQTTFKGLGQIYRNGAYLGHDYLTWGQKGYEHYQTEINKILAENPDTPASDPTLVDLRKKADRRWRQANNWAAKREMKLAARDAGNQANILTSKITGEILNAKYADEINPATGEKWGPLNEAEQQAVISIFTDHAQLIDALVKKGMPLRQILVMGNYDWAPGYHLSEAGAQLAVAFLNGDRTVMSDIQYERLAKAAEAMRGVSQELSQTALNAVGRRHAIPPSYLVPTPVLEYLVARLRSARLVDHLDAIEFLREQGIWDRPVDDPVRADFLRQIVSTLPDEIALDSSMYPPSMRESIEYYKRLRRSLNRDAIRAGMGERPLNPSSGAEGAADKWVERQRKIVNAIETLLDKKVEKLKKAEEAHSKKIELLRTYDLAEEYINGVDIKQLAKKYKLTTSEVEKILNRNEVVRKWRAKNEAQKNYEKVRRNSRKAGVGAESVLQRDVIEADAELAKIEAQTAQAEYDRALVDFKRQQQQAVMEEELASIERDMAETEMNDVEDDFIAYGGDETRLYEETPLVDESALVPEEPALSAPVTPQATTSEYLSNTKANDRSYESFGRITYSDPMLDATKGYYGSSSRDTYTSGSKEIINSLDIVSADLDAPIPYDIPYTTQNGDLPHIHAAAKQLVDWAKEVAKAKTKEARLKLILEPPAYVDQALAKRILRGMTRDERVKTLKVDEPNHPFKKFDSRVALFLRYFFNDIKLIDRYTTAYPDGITYVDWQTVESRRSGYGKPDQISFVSTGPAYDGIRGTAGKTQSQRIYFDGAFLEFESKLPREVILDALDALSQAVKNNDGAQELYPPKYVSKLEGIPGIRLSGLRKLDWKKNWETVVRQIDEAKKTIEGMDPIDPSVIVETGKEDLTGSIAPHPVVEGGGPAPKLKAPAGGKLKPTPKAEEFTTPPPNAVMGEGYKINRSLTKEVLRELDDLLWNSNLPIASWMEETKTLNDPLSSPDVVLEELANLDIDPQMWGDSWSEIDSKTKKVITELSQLVENSKAEIARRKAAGITIEPTWEGKPVKVVIQASDIKNFDRIVSEIEKNPKVKLKPDFKGQKVANLQEAVKLLKDSGYESGKPWDISYLDRGTLDKLSDAVRAINRYGEVNMKIDRSFGSAINKQLTQMFNVFDGQLVDRQPLPALKTVERPPLNMLNRRADICIIPCGNEKVAVPTAASDFYTGSMFRDALNTARQMFSDDRIYIMSAKHGLVTLDTVLEPYNLKMGQAGSVTPDIIARQLDAIVGSKSNILSFLPKDYHGVLDLASTSTPELASRALVEEAYAGTTGIGKQKAVLKKFREESAAPLPKPAPIADQAVEALAQILAADPASLAELQAVLERKQFLEEQIEQMRNPTPEEMEAAKSERMQAIVDHIQNLKDEGERLGGGFTYGDGRIRFWVTPIKGSSMWEWWYNLDGRTRRRWAREYFASNVVTNLGTGPRTMRWTRGLDQHSMVADMEPEQWGEAFITWAKRMDDAKKELIDVRNESLTPEEANAKNMELVQADDELYRLVEENGLDDDVIAAIYRANEIQTGVSRGIASNPSDVVPDMSIEEPVVRSVVYTQDMIDSLAATAAEKVNNAKTAMERLQALDEFIQAALKNKEGRAAFEAALAKQNLRYNQINIDIPEQLVKKREEIRKLRAKKAELNKRVNAVLNSDEYRLLQNLPADMPLTVAMDPGVYHPTEGLQYQYNGEEITPQGPMYLPTGGKSGFAGGLREDVTRAGYVGHQKLRSEYRRAGDRQTIFNLKELAFRASRDMRKITYNESWRSLIGKFGKKVFDILPEELVAKLEEEARSYARNMPTEELQSYVSDVPVEEGWTPGIGAEAPGVRSPRSNVILAERKKFGELINTEMRKRGFSAVDPWGNISDLISYERVNADTMYLPENVKERVSELRTVVTPSEWNQVLAGLNKMNRVFKTTTLVLSLMWQLGDLWTNMLVSAMTGVGFKEMGRKMMDVFNAEYGSLRSTWDPRVQGTLTPLGVMEREAPVQDISISTELQTLINPDLALGKEPGRLASSRPVKGAKFVANVAFKINETINRLSRHAYHLAILEDALAKIGKTIDEVADEGSWRSDPEIKRMWLDTAETANKWLGDFADLSLFERKYIQSIFPFWAWTKHIHKVFASLALDHPQSLAWYIYMGSLGSEMDQNDLLDLRFGTLPVFGGAVSVNFLNPLGDVAEGPVTKFLFGGGDLTGLGRMTGPVPRFGAGLLGFDLANMKQLSKPAERQLYSKTGQVQGGLINPGNLGQTLSQTAGFAAQQFPMATRLMNILPGDHIPGTQIALGPVSRYSTGEARINPKTGQPNQQIGGRLAALGRAFSVPFIPSRSDQQIQDVYNSAIARLKTVNNLQGNQNLVGTP